MKFSDLSYISKAIAVKWKSKHHCRDSNIWVFGEWFGKKCTDNSMYFANYVSVRDPGKKCYWITDEKTDTSLLNNQVLVLKRDSAEALHVLQTCGVAVFSQSFEDFISGGLNYTEGAISVQLWHGVPWKKIGRDGNYNPSLLRSLYYSLLNSIELASLYASPSDMFDVVLHSAFGVPDKRIVHAGYARNSVFYNAQLIDEGKKRILSKIQTIDRSIDLEDCRIIAYMPTFRNNPYGVAVSETFSFSSLQSNTVFMDFLNQNNAIVIEKAHFVNQIRDGINSSGGRHRVYSLNDITAQDLLCASDLLVTDYSGAFFDFLLLDRPIVHFLYDYEHYRTQDRGLYYKKEDVIGGEEADDEKQLINAIIRNIEDPDLYQERRHMIRSIYMKYDTADSSEVLYQAILEEIKRRNINESTYS